MTNARVSQEPVEVAIVSSTAPTVQVSQEPVEVAIVSSAAPNAQISQIAVEVLYLVATTNLVRSYVVMVG